MRIIIALLCVCLLVTVVYTVYVVRLSQKVQDYDWEETKVQIIKNALYTGEGQVIKNVPARDYQIDVYMDTVWMYDGDRYVGKYIVTDSSMKYGLDSLIAKDNL